MREQREEQEPYDRLPEEMRAQVELYCSAVTVTAGISVTAIAVTVSVGVVNDDVQVLDCFSLFLYRYNHYLYALCCGALCCAIAYRTVLYCNVLHCTVLHYSLLY